MYMCLMLKEGSRGICSRGPRWNSGDGGGPARYSCEKDPSGTRPNRPETGKTNWRFLGSSTRSVNSANIWGSSGRQHEATQRHHHTHDIISPPQKPLPDTTQHSQETDIHAPGGIRTRNPSKRVSAEPRLRPRGHWDRNKERFIQKYQLIESMTSADC